MSLIFTDGFDYLNTGQTAAAFGKWSSSQANQQVQQVGRTGNNGVQAASNHTTTKSLQTWQYTNEFVMGAAMYNVGGDSMQVFVFENGVTTHHAGFICSADGSITVYGRGTGLAATPSWTILPKQWKYVELKMKIHDTTGYYELRVEGQTILSATNIDTRNGGANGRIETIRIGAGSLYYLDDFYFINVDGRDPSDFLGPVRIYTLFPNASGTYSQFTRSTGTVNYTNVDETNPSMTDYNQSTASGQYDTYNFGDIAGAVSGQVRAIVVNNYALYASPNPQSLSNVIISSGYMMASGSHSLATSAGWYQTPFAITPTSGQWTISGVNNAEIGVLSAL